MALRVSIAGRTTLAAPHLIVSPMSDVAKAAEIGAPKMETAMDSYLARPKLRSAG